MPGSRVPETQEHIPRECEMQRHAIAELPVECYFAERAMRLLPYVEVVQGSTDASNKEVVGSPAEPQGNAGEQWLHLLCPVKEKRPDPHCHSPMQAPLERCSMAAEVHCSKRHPRSRHP